MEGFTVSKASQFLNSGMSSGDQSIKIDSNSLSDINSVTKSKSAPGETFADTLKSAVNQVNELQKSSDKAIQDLATGRTDNVADVMITAEKADIALKVMVQVRNKIIDAYNEIMKMQV